MLRMISLLITLAATSTVQARVNFTKLGTPEQQLQAYQHNKTVSARQRLSQMGKQNWDVTKPFSEIETTGFVAISGDDSLDLPRLREAIAKNLPPNVTMIIYIENAREAAALKSQYGKYLNDDQLKFLVVPMSYWSNPIWGRDSLPFPVYLQNKAVGLVDSGYPQNFEPDPAFEQALGLPMTDSGYVFRGGNLLFDLEANCWAENANEILGVDDPDSFFKENFGCKTVNMLPQDSGIGDIDERIKFLTGKEALTDSNSYAQKLRAKGYNVRMIPRINAEFETYMNTLVVNGTIFVPQMGISSDQAALDAYRAIGFTPVGVFTKNLADDGHGNIHCTTMNYPPGAFTQSKRGYDFVEFAN